MTNSEYWEQNKSNLIHIIHDLGYTPHMIAQEAMKEGMDWKDWIILFLT